jgi:hypothetical protein
MAYQRSCFTSANNELQGWTHPQPKELGFELVLRFGEPNFVLPNRLEWNMPLPYVNQIILLNESIPNNFPQPHNDFVYSVARIKVSPEHASVLALVSGCIIIDQLKGLTTARSYSLLKNQVILGFVNDYVNDTIRVNNVNDLKQEFANRLNDNTISKSGKFNPVYGVQAAKSTLNLPLKQRMNDLGKSSKWLFG